jgi:hypothetical protein
MYFTKIFIKFRHINISKNNFLFSILVRKINNNNNIKYWNTKYNTQDIHKRNYEILYLVYQGLLNKNFEQRYFQNQKIYCNIKFYCYINIFNIILVIKCFRFWSCLIFLEIYLI